MMYYVIFHEKLNLKNPKTFNEKLQWLKLYDRKPEYTQMVDKADVKDYVAGKIGKQYIIPTLGIWERFEDIDFEKLPGKFVLKTTHDSGGVVICKDKEKLDIEKAKEKLTASLKRNFYYTHREWPYKNVKPRIIAEEFIEIPNTKDIPDYKIFCFNGEPHYIQVIQDRTSNETIDFFDTNWNHQPFCGLNREVHNSSSIIHKPSNLDEMLAVARHLAADTSFVRVDLYHTGEKIYFGELTFFPMGGIGEFKPNDWNERIGNILTLPTQIGGG